MEFKEVVFEENKAILKEVKNFNIKQIVECGQCFRWEKKEELDYIIVAYGRVIEVVQVEDEVTIHNCTEEDFNNIWVDYFDLERDYTSIKKELSKDKLLRESVEFGYGIRILNQEPFEMLISFIISARNSIPVIKKTVKKICENWGTKLEYNGETYYSFPTPEQLKEVTLEEIKETGASFRSKYIVDTIQKVNGALTHKEEEWVRYNLDYIKALSDDECHKSLQEFMGVGAKVADCIMLFSMGKVSAFPVDVWVKRAMMYFYDAEEGSLNKIRIFARNKFKDLSGFAQQYLFYYARENSIKIED
ncbi:MAG: DNA-3-methyladenine glycosylase family protein [Clostridium sp.]